MTLDGGRGENSTVASDSSIARPIEIMNDDPHADIDERAERLLEDVDYDTELAKRMAKDARRITSGELSEEEFHERYREEVSEEFGVDYADFEETGNAGPADGTEDTPHPHIPLGDQPVSRRTVMKAGGAAAAGAAAAGTAGFLSEDSEDDTFENLDAESNQESVAAQSIGQRSMGMVIDTDACIKCLQCVQACKEENKTHVGDFWMYVHRYQREDREYEDETDCEALPRPCQHCDDAPCVRVCPNHSRIQHYDGRVLCNYDTCLGCKYCEVACPYHVNSFVYSDMTGYFTGQRRDEKDRWVAGPPPDGSCSKCTFCAHRRFTADEDGTTACSDACPVNAIQFGDLNDPESDPNQYLEDFDDDEIFQLHTDVSNPNVIYVGDDPSDVDNDRVSGPTTHADVGLEAPDPY